MILDHISNASLYAPLGQRFAAAFDFLSKVKFEDLKEEITKVVGDEVFAIRVDGPTKPAADAVWESHRRYADIHCQFGGGEVIGYSALPALAITRPYDETDDGILYAGSGRMIEMMPGEFLVLFPTDGHMPGVADGVHASSRKIVMKVLVA